MKQTMTLYLLSIRGTLAPATLDAARLIHNDTAGAPANVAAARALGDMSHMVYVPAGPTGPQAGEFLILDQWISMEGLNQFFANPHVQEQAQQIFTQRDPVVWQPADDFLTYHLPAPAARTERIVGVVRGLVHSRAAAQDVHNSFVAAGLGAARAAGNMSHAAYFRLTPPGTPESLEFLAVDTWMDPAGMSQYYAQPEFQQVFQQLFTAPPDATAWADPLGAWVEW